MGTVKFELEIREEDLHRPVAKAKGNSMWQALYDLLAEMAKPEVEKSPTSILRFATAKEAAYARAAARSWLRRHLFDWDAILVSHDETLSMQLVRLTPGQERSIPIDVAPHLVAANGKGRTRWQPLYEKIRAIAAGQTVTHNIPSQDKELARSAASSLARQLPGSFETHVVNSRDGAIVYVTRTA